MWAGGYEWGGETVGGAVGEVGGATATEGAR